MLVPIAVHMHAGLVGTNQTEVVLFNFTDEQVAKLRNVLDPLSLLRWEDYAHMMYDHAQSFGVYQMEDGGEFYEDDGQDPESEDFEGYHVVDPEIWSTGVYNPEVHDDYRLGGGSFMTERGVAEALAAYHAALAKMK